MVLRTLEASVQGIPHPTDWKTVPRGLILAAVGVRSWSALARVTQHCTVYQCKDGYRIEPWRTVGRGGVNEGIPGTDVHLPPDASAADIGHALEKAFEACDPLPEKKRGAKERIGPLRVSKSAKGK